MSRAETQSLIETVLGVHDTPEGHVLRNVEVHADGGAVLFFDRPTSPTYDGEPRRYCRIISDPAGNLRRQKRIEDAGYARGEWHASRDTQRAGVQGPAMTPSDAGPEEPAPVVYPQVPFPPVLCGAEHCYTPVIEEGWWCGRCAFRLTSNGCQCQHCLENGNR